MRGNPENRSLLSDRPISHTSRSPSKYQKADPCTDWVSRKPPPSLCRYAAGDEAFPGFPCKQRKQLKCGKVTFFHSSSTSSSWWKRHEGRNLRRLITLCPLSWERGSKSSECRCIQFKTPAHEMVSFTCGVVHPTSMNWTSKIPPRHAQGFVSKVILDPM